MLNFTQYYDSSTSSNIVMQAPQYNLPLKTDHISNFHNFSKIIPLTNNSLNLLEKNGFVAISDALNQKEDDIIKSYATLRALAIPIFITADSLLHICHIQFEQTLKNIEEGELYDELYNISYQLLIRSIKDYYSTTTTNQSLSISKPQ